MHVANIKHHINNIVPFSVFKMFSSNKVIFPYYHIVSDDPVLHVSSLYKYKNVRQFTDDLDFLLKHYEPLCIFDIIHDSVNFNRSKCYFLLTFDDGFSEIHDVIAPILLSKGIPAVFFINSAFIDNKELCYLHKSSILASHISNGLSTSSEDIIQGLLAQIGIVDSNISQSILKLNYNQRDVLDLVGEIAEIDFQDYVRKNKPYLSSDQINKLIYQGFGFGAHSIDHPFYANITLEEQLSQTIESIKYIKEQFNISYGAFAFPHSDSGVSIDFFERINMTGLIDISFGTGGMLDNDGGNHFQRFSLEKPILPAINITTMHYMRRFYRKIKKV